MNQQPTRKAKSYRICMFYYCKKYSKIIYQFVFNQKNMFRKIINICTYIRALLFALFNFLGQFENPAKSFCCLNIRLGMMDDSVTI